MTSYYAPGGPASSLISSSSPPVSLNGNNGSTTNSSSNSTMSHAVSRSSELLSCARTALKILKTQYQPSQQKQPPWWMSVDPSQLHLHQETTSSRGDSQIAALLVDGLELLRTMQTGLQRLEGLVRRRGHVNDPTKDIAVEVRNLETDAKELAVVVASLQSPSLQKSKQHGRHLELVAVWLEQVASQQTLRLKEVLKVRGSVLADQAQRRKLLNPSSAKKKNSTIQKNSSNGSSSARMPMDSPLFTMTTTTTAATRSSSAAAPRSATALPRPTTANNTAKLKSSPRSHESAPHLYGGSAAGTTTTSGYYGGGGYGGGSSGYGGYGGGGYGGSSAPSTTGMRQRKAASLQSKTSSQDNDDTEQIQAQIQMRQQDRQTQERLEHARMAERSLADLGQLFGKMSTLIHSQGEVLEKIEDDVERASLDVHAGHEEINKLHALKKGNRALILKVFGILIFFIIFMRLY